MFGLSAAEIFDDFIQAIMMLFDVLVANSPNFLDDFIEFGLHSLIISRTHFIAHYR